MLFDARLSQDFAARLLKEGIYVTGFYYPVVPKGEARIRVQLSAAHTRENLDKALKAFIKVGKELKGYQFAITVRVSGNHVPDLHIDFCTHGKKHIHPRSKFDEAKLITLNNLFSFVSIGNDPPGHGPGDLPYKDHFSMAVLYNDCGSFI